MNKGVIIGIAVAVGIALTLLFVVIGDEFDVPQFAKLEADYDHIDNKLSVFLFLTNSDGKNVKAAGTGRITVTELDLDNEKIGTPYSYEVEFEKDGFQTWRDSSGLKHTAHAFYINQELAGRGLWWDVSMDITLEDGSQWADVDIRVISADSPQETMQTIPEPIPEPIQQQVPAPGFEDVPEMIVQEETFPSFDCSGTARCFTGKVTDVIDGDTIRVGAQSIRFSLASTPELNESGGLDAKQFVELICPVGSDALVDEDDGQTEGSYGRIVAVIYCNGINLNEAVIEAGFGTVDTRFCDKSEFKNEEWTGCSVKIIEDSCDPSYPDFCIPSPPPDLDCKDIPQKRFTVIGSDPHRFDGDKDGIGCES